MGYDIYDTDTANMVGSFATEHEALAMVQRAVEEDGPESVESWALGRSDRSGDVLSGQQLIERALGAHV